ncbi:hypothetical protein [Streptomyces hoynatensis]|uniref:Uncharacterized protein n=1 Tax=Streptomyces hoynatensis TaxID=1141874 RepID=A0A3A9YSS5_9ACTN|nr:hypothetical protein [Streptomyces hoynatensis]RKN38544.1 hypothetical protein D7294_24045 [Streptomyces hoynatensis]
MNRKSITQVARRTRPATSGSLAGRVARKSVVSAGWPPRRTGCGAGTSLRAATRPGTSWAMASWVGTTASRPRPGSGAFAACSPPGGAARWPPRWVPAAETTSKTPGTRESAAA